MDTPNVPVDCASCARLREQVATLAHQSAGLREESVGLRATVGSLSAEVMRLRPARTDKHAPECSSCVALRRERDVLRDWIRGVPRGDWPPHSALAVLRTVVQVAATTHLAHVALGAEVARLRAMVAHTAVLRSERLIRRERLARWAGVVAADTERRHTRVATTCFHLATGALRDVLEAHTPLRAAYNDAVRDLARSWRSA